MYLIAKTPAFRCKCGANGIFRDKKKTKKLLDVHSQVPVEWHTRNKKANVQ